MTLPGTVTAMLIVASPFGVIYLVLYALPQMQHSRFRHELWDLRDAIVDDLLDDRLAMSREVRELLLRVHLAIKYAPEHTMRSGITSALLLRDAQNVPNLRKTLEGARLPHEERVRLLMHFETLQKSTVHHLLFGSPSGWAAYAAAALMPARREGRVQRTAEKELSALPRLYPEANGFSMRELATCA